MIYTHVARKGPAWVTSPLDLLAELRPEEVEAAVQATRGLGAGSPFAGVRSAERLAAAVLLQLSQDSGLGANPCGFVRISPDLRAQAGSQRAQAGSQIRLDSSDSSCSVRFILIRLDSSFRLDSFCLVRFV